MGMNYASGSRGTAIVDSPAGRWLVASSVNKPHPHMQHLSGATEAEAEQNESMKRLLRLLQRLMGTTDKPPLHTPEELECFKKDAIENRGKHY